MNGLNDHEVLVNREKYGSNKLPEPKLKKWWNFAAEALSEKITLILIAIAVVQIILGAVGVMGISEPIMILIVLAIVTGIAVKTGLGVQKSEAELRAKTAVRYCTVIRNGKVQSINKDDLVVGDLVCVGSGQEIFADGYIVEGVISVNNSAINGETKECKKVAVEGYKHIKTTTTESYTDSTSLFAGTVVMSGECKMIVTDVGVNTVNGETLVNMQTLEAPKTALRIAIDKLCDVISRYGTIAAIVTFVVLTMTGIADVGFREYFNGDILNLIEKITQNASVALTIIVAAVPEGLPMIVQLVTKQNVKIMESFNILAKNPDKIPELAYVDLICTDKTGTLTTGVMTPKKVIDGLGNDIEIDSLLWNIAQKNICLNNSATFDCEHKIVGGNSIDRAILSIVPESFYFSIQNTNQIRNKQPFSSENKYSAVDCNNNVQYYKGAPEKIIERCSDLYDKDGTIIPLKKEDKDILYKKIEEMTQKSMRCIALASSYGKFQENVLPDDMKLVVIIGVVDPVRDEVPNAVSVAQNAGIQVIEITGDCFETAKAVAAESGIYKDGDVALTNDQFENMSDDEVKKILPKLRVISRCSPNTKLRLVTLAQEIGRSVAMTGDGVNDSPALKKSDVGFGMQSGSDVAKEASDIILTDDNFASIVKGVELGRTFMHNIMMFLEFQLPINFSLLVLSIIFPVLFKGSVLLASVQILIVNIIMDSLNSLSFGGEPPKAEYMNEFPIKKGSGLFIRGAKKRIALSTLVFIVLFIATMIPPVSNMFHSDKLAITARFSLLCFMSVFNGFCIRTDHINLFNGLSKNKLFYWIALGILAGTIILCTICGDFISAKTLDFKQWAVVISLALVVIPVDILRKIATRKGKEAENI